jgi:hypothetical protein
MTHVLRSDLVVTLEVKEAIISCLQSRIKHKTDKLNLGDPAMAVKLEKMKNDDWFNIQLNMWVL